jgi:uncharacterized protein YndB with AHSA1/START domain
MWPERFWCEAMAALVTEVARGKRVRRQKERLMIEIKDQLEAIHRQVDRTDESVGVLLRRRYDAEVTDVWSALTEPDRVKRWFYPLTGDLRPGGAFQLEGNAGGDILTCEPPSYLKVTFGGPTSVVELRLAADGDHTVLELEHVVPLDMAGSGAGALFVGPGWDGAFLALGLVLVGEPIGDPNSPESLEFMRNSVDAWVAAVESSGTATEAEIAAGKAMSIAQFAPES